MPKCLYRSKLFHSHCSQSLLVTVHVKFLLFFSGGTKLGKNPPAGARAEAALPRDCSIRRQAGDQLMSARGGRLCATWIHGHMKAQAKTTKVLGQQISHSCSMYSSRQDPTLQKALSSINKSSCQVDLLRQVQIPRCNSIKTPPHLQVWGRLHASSPRPPSSSSRHESAAPPCGSWCLPPSSR